MALTDGDREWLEGKFTRLHERLDQEGSKIHRLDKRVTVLETGATTECAAAITKHEKKSMAHNPLLALPVIGTLVTVYEFVKKFLHM